MTNNQEKTLEELVDEVDDCKTQVFEQLDEGRETMKQLKTDVQHLSLQQEQLYEMVKELVDIYRSAKGFVRVLGWVGVVVKWTAAIGIPIGAFFYFLKTGYWPKH